MDYESSKKCWDNGIKIYPKPIEQGTWKKSPRCKLVIDHNGKIKEGQEVYNQDAKMYKKIEELYKHFANKIYRHEIKS